jgi:hypothetical protein
VNCPKLRWTDDLNTSTATVFGFTFVVKMLKDVDYSARGFGMKPHFGKSKCNHYGYFGLINDAKNACQYEWEKLWKEEIEK